MKNRELNPTRIGIANVLACLTIKDYNLMEQLIKIDSKIEDQIKVVDIIRKNDIGFMNYLDSLEEIRKNHAFKDKKGELKKVGKEYDVPPEKHNLVNHEIEKLNEKNKTILDIQEKVLDKDSGIKDKIKREDIPDSINGLTLAGIRCLWI